jgi:glycerophosphoryl diester phosphodiesterase
MTPTRRAFAALTIGLPAAWSLAGPAKALARPALVIATGGAAGGSPTGGQAAYEAAIAGGADLLAIDVTPSKDGNLVALRDHELSEETDVAARPEFAGRRQSHTVGGRERHGWFAEDFTLAELKTLTLGAPDVRRRGRPPAGPRQVVLTLDEMIALARQGSVRTARVIGLHVTILRAGYFAGLDLAIEPRLASAIRASGYNSPAAAMFVASPDLGVLKTIGDLTRVRRVMRLEAEAPAPMSPEGLKALRAQAEVIAAPPERLLDLTAPKSLTPTPLIARAHAAGLGVHAWTSGYDTPFPPPPLRPGDARRLLAALFAAGADAVAGDLAAPIARARDEAGGRGGG